MYKIFTLSIMLVLFLGCQKKKEVNLSSFDAEALTEQKCSSCHDLSMPSISKKDEKAPPMMAIVFHLSDFMKGMTKSETKAKFIPFVNDYIFNPSKSKSFCDKKSLEEYGLMPSQKGKLSEGELNAIVHYIYEKYDSEKFYKAEAEKRRIAKLPVQQRVIEMYRCNNCHDIKKDKIAPSFTKISKKYGKNDVATLVNSIKNGSKNKYSNSKIPMPPFKKISNQDLIGMAEWILSLNK